jgi:NADH dehydrogenase/NADH:ubiquinone oxidoreductase subunit G
MSEIHPENTASIVLNGVRLVVDSSHTILDVAKASGIEIPTLCHQEGWRPDGNCRACLVDCNQFQTRTVGQKYRTGVTCHGVWINT